MKISSIKLRFRLIMQNFITYTILQLTKLVNQIIIKTQKKMGQQCQGESCCYDETPNLQLPNEREPQLKCKRLQFKQSLVFYEDQKLATIYEGQNQECMEKLSREEEEVEKIQSTELLKSESLRVTNRLNKKLKRIETMKDMSVVIEEEMKIVESEALRCSHAKTVDKNVDFYQFALLYQKIVHFYEVHDIDSACDLIPSLHKMESSIRSERNLTQQEFQTQLQGIEEQWQTQNESLPYQPFQRQLLTQLKALLDDMNYYCNLVDMGVFLEKYNKNGIKISSGKVKGKESTGVLIETQLNSPFENLSAFFNDIKFFPDFLPFCQKATELLDCGRNSKVGYALINLPVISKRQVFFQGLAYNRLNHKGEILLYARSIHDKPDVQKQLGVKVHPNKDFVQMTYQYFTITYQPLREGVGKLKIAANFNHGLSYVPDFIQEYAIRDFGKMLVKNMLNITNNFKGSKWEKSIQTSPGVFLLLRQTIHDYLQAKKLKNEQQKIII